MLRLFTPLNFHLKFRQTTRVWRTMLQSYVSQQPSQFRTVHECAIGLLLFSFVCAQAVYGPIDLIIWPKLFAAIVLLLGVPHGALDIEIVCARRNVSHRVGIAKLLTAYVGLTAAVTTAWLIAPAATLFIFLVVSSYHFGGDWHHDTLARLCTGCAVLSAPAVFHPSQVAEIFGWLSSPGAAHRLTACMAIAALPLLAATIGLSVWQIKTSALLELSSVIMGALVLPPLTFFVLYFCFLHSVRHLVDTVSEFPDRSARNLVVAGLPFAVIAMGGCVIGAAAMMSLAPGPAVISSVFIGLAALTVPHIMFVDAA